MNDSPKIRQSNIELLRIAAMLMIVGHHMSVHGIYHVTAGENAYSIYSMGTQLNKAIISLFAPGGEIGVAIFFMITGYFQIKKNTFSLKKIILQSFFYGIFCTAAFGIVELLCGMTPLYVIKNIGKFAIKAVFTPITGNVWWFVTAYIIIMLLSPFINRYLNVLNKKGYIVTILFMWIFWYYLAYKNGVAYYSVERGILFYVIGAYCRNYTGRLSGRLCKAGYLILFILTWTVGAALFYKIAGCNVIAKVLPEAAALTERYQMINMMAVVPICAYAIFRFFESLCLGQINIINTAARATLGVYLIHDSDVGRECIWKLLARPDAYWQSAIFPLAAVLTVLAVYISCTAVDMLRIKYIEPRFMSLLDNLEDIFRKRYCRSEM